MRNPEDMLTSPTVDGDKAVKKKSKQNRRLSILRNVPVDSQKKLSPAKKQT